MACKLGWCLTRVSNLRRKLYFSYLEEREREKGTLLLDLQQKNWSNLMHEIFVHFILHLNVHGLCKSYEPGYFTLC